MGVWRMGTARDKVPWPKKEGFLEDDDGLEIKEVSSSGVFLRMHETIYS